MQRTSIFLLAFGLTFGSAALAQDAWTNDDPLCAPTIYQGTVNKVQDQKMAERDAQATDDYYKQIKNAPKNASDKLLSCVDVAWPEVTLGAAAGIEQIIKKVGDKAVDQACKEMRNKVRQATSNFATSNLSSTILGSVTSGDYSGIADAAKDAATKAATNEIRGAVSNTGLPGTITTTDTTGAFGGLIDLIKPGASKPPAK